MRHIRSVAAMTAVLSLAGRAAGSHAADLQSSPDAQEHGVQGRWVVVGVGFLVAYNFVGDSVEVLMYPPQAPAMTYRVNGDSVETESGGRRIATRAFSTHGDTLDLRSASGVTSYVRLQALPAAVIGLGGSWRALAADRSVITFRSDGRKVIENRAPSDMRLHGDTLEMAVDGKHVSALLRRSGDTMTIVWLAGGQPQKLVRRAWGCFGVREMDLSASECR
jgi:hypothetical protein